MSDKSKIQQRFEQNFRTYNRLAIVQRQVAAHLGCMLSKWTGRKIDRLLEVGCGTGFLTQEILNNLDVTEYFLNDLSKTAYTEVVRRTKVKNYHKYNFIDGDAEYAKLPDECDLIVSASTLQWFKDFPAFIRKVSTQLKSNGIFAFTTFGPNNFNEIKSTLGVGLNYHSLNDTKHLLSEAFEVLYAEEWTQEEQFANPMDVLRHIKQTGVSGVNSAPLTKGKLKEYMHMYQSGFSNENGSVYLTYHPIVVIAKKIK